MDRLTLAGTALKYFHICALFDSRDEEYETLNPFYKEGLDNGEANLHIVDPALMDDHRTRLCEGGIDAAACECDGQLNVVAWQDAYLDANGVFDKDRMLGAVENLTGAGRDRNFARLRIMGNMGWAIDGDTPGTSSIIAYEAEVNEVLSRNKQPAVCVYDLARLSGGMLMDLLRTHPVTIVRGVLQENPYFTPPAVMLAELRRRAH